MFTLKPMTNPLKILINEGKKIFSMQHINGKGTMTPSNRRNGFLR